MFLVHTLGHTVLRELILTTGVSKGSVYPDRYLDHDYLDWGEGGIRFLNFLLFLSKLLLYFSYF